MSFCFDASIQYPGDKTLTVRPPRPEPGTGSGGATYQEEAGAVVVLQKR